MQHALPQSPPAPAPRDALSDEPDTERTRLPTRAQALRHFVRGTLRPLPRLLLPTLAVAGLYVLLFFVDLSAGIDMAIFGVRDAATSERIFARYGALIRGEQVRILLTYLVIGLVVGAATNALTLLWERTDTWPPRALRYDAEGQAQPGWSLGRRLAMSLALGLVFHLWQLAHAIARFPQLFAEYFYDHGGLRRRIMVALTHQIPSPLIDGLAIGAIVGLVVAPLLSPTGRRWVALLRAGTGSPWVRRVSVAAVLTLGLLPLGLRVSSPGGGAAVAASAPPAKDGRPSVLLIGVDSLRADRVGPWAKAVAPNIAQLAGKSVRFDAAFVTVPRTFPSFVTLLTGRYPHHHGIRTMFPSAAERAAVGPALPGILGGAGYQTAVLSDFCGEIFSRIDLGFHDVRVPLFDVKTIVRQRSVTVHPNLLPYVDGALGRREFPALDSLAELSDPELLTDRSIAALDRLKGKGQPFFMTVFYSSAHFPYAAPAPYYRRFTDPSYDGPFRYHKPPWADAQVTPEDVRQVRGLYNGAVAAADAAIGRLLKGLAERGLAEDTIVILLADHGENLYDEPGRGMGHGDHLEGGHSQQIPLLVYDPVHRFPAHAVPGIVRDIDLAPTLMELAGATPGKVPMDGVSLAPLLRGERQSLDLPAFAETELWFTPEGPGFDEDNRLPYPGVTATTDVDPSDDIFLSERWRDLVTVAKHRALRTDRWKLIYRPTRSGVHWSLYDLRADPRELHDVSQQHPKELQQLQAQLLRFLAADPRAVVEGGYVIPQ